jgi:outer membrane protein OmpA-like peptidoglycan-associated protein
MKLIATIAILAGLLAACVSAGDMRPLDDARSEYRAAATDPQVQAHAPVELKFAEHTLAQAERLAREREDTGLIAHQAYLATQRARSAQQLGHARAAEAQRVAAAEERGARLLAEREHEAEAARAKARQADIARTEAELQLKEAERQQASAPADLSAEVRRLQEELAELKTQQSAQQTERGWILTLRSDLLFDGGSATLKPGAQRALDNLAQFLRRNPGRDIAIEGFTDSTGSPEGNRALSERRAAAVKEALVRKGIEPMRIDARGYGPAFPVATNTTPTGRQLNRRVEIIINPS